jgi:hypothetical protein
MVDRQLITTLAKIFESECMINKHQQFDSLFNSSCVPAINIEDYLVRIRTYCRFSDSCFLIAFLYLNRIKIPINNFNVHRLVITSIVIACKFHEDCDDLELNTHYAKVGGITLKNLNTLEIEFLSYLDFNLCFSIEEIQMIEKQLNYNLFKDKVEKQYEMHDFSKNMYSEDENMSDNFAKLKIHDS